MQLPQTKKRLTLRQQDARVALLLVAPSLIIIIAISLQPILTTLYLSFFETTPGSTTPDIFRGLGNYLQLLADKLFWQSIWRTFYFTIISVGLELVLGISIAQLIHSHPPGWRFLRTSLIIPWAVPTIVNGAMWRWIYNADYGALNGLLMQLGLIDHYIPWLIKPYNAMNLVILADGVRITYHATLLEGVEVGEQGMVGALAVATKRVRPYHVHLGIPAVPKFVKPNAPPDARDAGGT